MGSGGARRRGLFWRGRRFRMGRKEREGEALWMVVCICLE